MAMAPMAPMGPMGPMASMGPMGPMGPWFKLGAWECHGNVMGMPWEAQCECLWLIDDVII